LNMEFFLRDWVCAETIGGPGARQIWCELPLAALPSVLDRFGTAETLARELPSNSGRLSARKGWLNRAA